jgi:hypothetical protein
LIDTAGGSTSNPGIGLAVLLSSLEGPGAPLLRSRGEGLGISEPVSALDCGVGIVEATSPKISFISSKRTPRVSG